MIGDLVHFADNSKCCLHCPFGMVPGLDRRAEKSHDLIAHQFIQSPIVVEYGV